MHLCLPTSLKTQMIYRIQMKKIKLKNKKKKTVRLEVRILLQQNTAKRLLLGGKGLGITYCFISLSYD
jgi:hypothetical protein